MNTLISIPIEDLSALRDAVILAKQNALYNEKRCRECAFNCSSETLSASFLRGAELAIDEQLKYQRLINLFSF